MNRARRRAACLVAAVAVASFVPRAARADEDPRKKAAEAVFQEGVKLHAQGKNEEALAKLQKAYDTYPSPNTLGGIARVEQAMGRSLDAIRHYREAVRNPLMHPENADYARRAIADLEKQLARIDVKGPKGLVVTIDKRDVVLPMTEALDVKADTYELSGKLGETRYEGRATAPIGKVTEIEMKPAGGASASAVAPPPPPPQSDTHPTEPPPVEPSRSFWTTGHVLGVVAGGLAVVGAGVGVGFMLSRESHVSDENAIAEKDPRACVDPSSAPCRDFKDARDGASSAQTGAIVSFAAAGVFAATAVVLLWPRGGAASSSGSARTMVVPGNRSFTFVHHF